MQSIGKDLEKAADNVADAAGGAANAVKDGAKNAEGKVEDAANSATDKVWPPPLLISMGYASCHCKS